MQNRETQRKIIMVAVSLLLASPAGAFDMGNMMNPSKWMGGNNDRYDDYDDYGDYGGGPGYGFPGGPPGYGYGGGPGYGYGGGPGYGPGPGYGYGGGYGGVPGYGAAPGYGGTSPYAAPGAASNEAEITRLKERIRQLEGDLR